MADNFGRCRLSGLRSEFRACRQKSGNCPSYGRRVFNATTIDMRLTDQLAQRRVGTTLARRTSGDIENVDASNAARWDARPAPARVRLPLHLRHGKLPRLKRETGNRGDRKRPRPRVIDQDVGATVDRGDLAGEGAGGAQNHPSALFGGQTVSKTDASPSNG